MLLKEDPNETFTVHFVNGNTLDYRRENMIKQNSKISNPNFEILKKDTTLRDQLEWNTNYFKEGIKKAGLDFIDGDSAIVPIMLYDAKLSQEMADELLKLGIYVIGFFYPVVPKDKARIRVQLSAAHTKEHLDKAIAAFTNVGKKLNIIQ